MSDRCDRWLQIISRHPIASHSDVRVQSLGVVVLPLVRRGNARAHGFVRVIDRCTGKRFDDTCCPVWPFSVSPCDVGKWSEVALRERHLFQVAASFCGVSNFNAGGSGSCSSETRSCRISPCAVCPRFLSSCATGFKCVEVNSACSALSLPAPSPPSTGY